jgi:hypothetical protein
MSTKIQHVGNIVLLPVFNTITASKLKNKFPGKRIFACDFPVMDAHKGIATPWGFTYEDVENIDHHAPVPSMQRPISSGPLSITYVKRYGPANKGNDQIVLHHTDCDSVTSGLIMQGYLPPEDKFGAAAVNADHFGGTLPIANLLQSLQYTRNLPLIMRELNYYLEIGEFSNTARPFIQARDEKKRNIETLIEQGKVKTTNGITYMKADFNIDSSLFPAYFPESKGIVVSFPGNKGISNISVRLGPLAPEGLYLEDLQFPNWGGRWNAGSTRRLDGTDQPIEKYVDILDKALARHTK